MEEARCKVVIPLGASTLPGDISWPPYETESLWALRMDAAHVKLLNTPFFARGYSYLDQLEVVELAGSDVAGSLFAPLRVVARSGHGTVRAILVADEYKEIAENAISIVEELGCSWESGGAVLAIDIPPGVSSENVLDILRQCEAQGAIIVDVGLLVDS